MEPPGSPLLRPPERASAGELTLERWRSEHQAELFEAIAQSLEHLRPWMTFAMNHSRDSVARFLRESEEGWEQGARFEYALRNPAGQILGSAGLMGRIGPGGLEIGYWVHSSHTRRGNASLAAALLSEMALSLATVDHVQIHHNEANHASGSVPARLGFRRLGAFPSESSAPSNAPLDVRWRMDEDAFPQSPARALLARARLKQMP